MSGAAGAAPDPLAALAGRARAGERAALEDLLAALRDDVYDMALRMLWHPEDAEDAAQEILLRIAAGLGGFRGDAAVRTWAFRVAANHLLSARRRRMERASMTFERFAADLEDGLADPADHGVDEALLEEEVKLGCTQAMLLCLDRGHRLALILDTAFGLPSADAAAILGVSAAAYRKRLQRARERIAAFMEGHCGLVSASAACRCARRIEPAVARGRVAPQALLFARHPRRSARLAAGVGEMEWLHAAAGVLRSHPGYAAPERLREAVSAALSARPLSILEEG